MTQRVGRLWGHTLNVVVVSLCFKVVAPASPSTPSNPDLCAQYTDCVSCRSASAGCGWCVLAASTSETFDGSGCVPDVEDSTERLSSTTVCPSGGQLVGFSGAAAEWMCPFTPDLTRAPSDFDQCRALAQLLFSGPVASLGELHEHTGWLKLLVPQPVTPGSSVDGVSVGDEKAKKKLKKAEKKGKTKWRWTKQWCEICDSALCCAEGPTAASLDPIIDLTDCSWVGKSTSSKAIRGELQLTCRGSSHRVRLHRPDDAADRRRWGNAFSFFVTANMCRDALAAPVAATAVWHHRQIAILVQAAAYARTGSRGIAVPLWTAALAELGYMPPPALEVVCGWALVEAATAVAAIGTTGTSEPTTRRTTLYGAELLSRGWTRQATALNFDSHRQVVLEGARAALAANDSTLAASTLTRALELRPTCFECLLLLERTVAIAPTHPWHSSTTVALDAGRSAYAQVHDQQAHLEPSRVRSGGFDFEFGSVAQVGDLEVARDRRELLVFHPPAAVLQNISRALGLATGLDALLAIAGSDLVAVDIKPPGPGLFGPTNPMCFKTRLPLSVAVRRISAMSGALAWPHYINIGQGDSAQGPYHRPLHHLSQHLDTPRRLFEEALGADAGHVNLWLGGGGTRGDGVIATTTSQRHSDQYDNVYVVLSGTKRFVLSPPTASVATVVPIIHVAANGVQTVWRDNGTRSAPVQSALFDRGDTVLSTAEHGTETVFTLEAGDALFLPAGWFHQVVSDTSDTSKSELQRQNRGTHCAINFWFNPPPSDQ